MPSNRPVIAYRPDDREMHMVKALQDKYGLSMTRLIGFLIRQAAERENVMLDPSRATAQTQNSVGNVDHDLIAALREGIADGEAGRTFSIEETRAHIEEALTTRFSKDSIPSATANR